VNRSKFHEFFILTMSLLVMTIAHAQIKVGNLQIIKPSVRATSPGQLISSAYLTIENKGSTTDRLVAVSFARAKEVQLHEMKMDGDKMMMRQMTGIEIPANGSVELKPGGYHLMLMGLDSAIKDGEQLKMTLQFEKAGKVDVVFPSQALGGMKMH
jgi:copper(I)-binding protein